ncbi:MAG: prepilin-type N-terminal cleavage/methylation domain-containing protein [Magnetococcales bacterium]|nr:prepilin-type N-terminal cleavage/methylation domain-containing protein [Magnetococcales bacterium]
MPLTLSKNERGFTLIEIAIVLVIIGLLIGGVLKGQSMVKNSKIKRIATDTQSVQGAVNAYMDSHWFLPGDDSGAATHWATASGAGNGNGMIAGLFDAATKTTDESALAWNHLYCEGLAKGTCVAAGTAVTNPTNPLGGTTGIADGRTTNVLGLAAKVVCMERIPVDYAMIYDSQFDDGAGDTGSIRGSDDAQVAATPGAATAYTLGEVIHICSSF